MSIFSRLLRDSSSPNTLSDREKRLRRRRFLKGLEDHSRSMRMEQLEPRLLLTGDFFAADEWAIIKEGSTATTAEDLPSGSLDDGVYYLGVAPEDGPLDPAEAPIKVIATGAGYIGRAGGTEPLHFMDVKTYIKNKMEWELLFCGHFDLEEDETFTSELTVLSCPGGLDTLEIAGLAFEPSGIGFNQPGGEGRTQSALLQGDVVEEVTDCDGDTTSIAAGTVGVASPGVAYREVLSLHGELMPIVDFDTIHSIHDVQTEISASGETYDSNGRFVENVLGTSTGQNWIWANRADNILTGGQQADTFTATRGGDHFIYGAQGNDSMLLGPTGFASHLNTSGKGILFEADGVIPIADLDGAIVIVVDLNGSSEAQIYEFDNDSNVSVGVQAIDIGSYPTAMEIAESDFDEDQILGHAISKLRDAIHNDFTRYDADPTTPEPSVELVGAGLGLPGEEIAVLATGGITNNVRTYDLDHLYEHQAGERVIGNNVLIGGNGADNIFSHDGSDLILAEQDSISGILGALTAREQLDFIQDFNDLWRFDDDAAESRLGNILDYLNNATGNSSTSLTDYLIDDGDVDQVRLDSGYEIDLPEEEWSKGVDVFFGDISQILDVDEMSLEEDDLVNGLP